MSAEDEFAGSELVALLPMRWTPLGDSGIEVLAGPASSGAVPLRYRTRVDVPAEPVKPTVTRNNYPKGKK